MILVSQTKNFMFKDTAVTLGKFDGMHRGHMSLLKSVAEYKKEGYIPTVFTFDTSPYEVVNKKNTEYLLTRFEKHAICEAAGIEILIEYPFDNETMHMEADEFVNDILIKKLGAAKIVVGEDFHFGKDRKGNVETLGRIFDENCLDIKKKMLYQGNEISSTFIKKCLCDGDVKMTAEMLGRQYGISGVVVEGKKIGRTINFPTINLKINERKILPASGVYISKVVINEKKYTGITNVGSNPTVTDEKNVKVETHILGVDENLYGKDATVYFCEWIRDEKKFDNIDMLRKQIENDVKKAIEYK